MMVDKVPWGSPYVGWLLPAPRGQQRNGKGAVPGQMALESPQHHKKVEGGEVSVPSEVAPCKHQEKEELGIARSPVLQGGALSTGRKAVKAVPGKVASSAACKDVYPMPPTSGRASCGTAGLKDLTIAGGGAEGDGVVRRPELSPEEKKKAVVMSGATPKHHTAGVPLEGPLSLASFCASSPFLQRPGGSGTASKSGIFPPKLPPVNVEVVAPDRDGSDGGDRV